MSTAIFSETLRWPLWLWGFLLFLLGSLDLALWAALDNYIALGTTGIFFLAVILGYIRLAMKITITESELRINHAHIELQYITSMEEIKKDQIRSERGPNLDPAAFLSLRFWVSSAVKITIKDERDSTPYWLVSSKKAKAFIKAAGF